MKAFPDGSSQDHPHAVRNRAVRENASWFMVSDFGYCGQMRESALCESDEYVQTGFITYGLFIGALARVIVKECATNFEFQ